MSKKKRYQELKTTPFETGIRNFPSVAKFFMYYAPGIDAEALDVPVAKLFED